MSLLGNSKQYSDNNKGANPFSSFKNQIKTNLKNLKKEKETNNQTYPHTGTDDASPREVAAMAKYHWTEEVPSFNYADDIKRLELHYNVLW